LTFANTNHSTVRGPLVQLIVATESFLISSTSVLTLDKSDFNSVNSNFISAKLDLIFVMSNFISASYLKSYTSKCSLGTMSQIILEHPRMTFHSELFGERKAYHASQAMQYSQCRLLTEAARCPW
jgi:hypothetical protein